jgi:ApaG protein
MSVTITEGIKVEVEANFVAQQSVPALGHYFFAYTVIISNEGPKTAQLISRHWIITDGNGRVQDVKGPGVIGEQPVLRPGQSFTYTSACPLPTPHGWMEGSYQMVRDDGEGFDAKIATFELVVPDDKGRGLLN